jgi:hypothetical protein
MPRARENRTASTPAPLKGSLTSLRVLQTIDRIVKEAAGGSIPPPTRSAEATRPKQGETPAACSRQSEKATRRPFRVATRQQTRRKRGKLARQRLLLVAFDSPAARVILPDKTTRSRIQSNFLVLPRGFLIPATLAPIANFESCSEIEPSIPHPCYLGELISV